ncbi:MAG: beta-1,6-N-acetylglucosaminyltransferase [Dinoroseobacter sp.]|nr:beta-1,6-N-acetylglucosaminyltransferase [Dinoroseobacter sp.]
MSSARLGFVMLAHTELGRASQMARHLASRGYPVALHLDTKLSDTEIVKVQASLSDLRNVFFPRRYNCGWGLWSMVEATQASAELLLSEMPDVRHVALISGDCLPLRPVDQLADLLDRSPTTDFIESVTVEDVPWTIGGLQEERFTLRFPFSWRTHRKLFDRYVNLQRRCGFRRQIPSGIAPHLGSQWWCLTRASLEAILTDPRRAEFDRYFSKVWIPDESYFQTLIRRVSVSIESRSLMLSKFDAQGKPFTFYDDHMDLLENSDRFLVRKVWPRAEKLYERLLPDQEIAAPPAASHPHRIEKIFDDAISRDREGRPGLFMQSRFPSDTWSAGKTAAPYYVFQGYDEVVEGFASWLSRWTGARVHGHLFDPQKAEFAEEAQVFNGGLTSDAALRDHNSERFLTNLIWNARAETQCFLTGPYDNQAANDYMSWDPNAHFAVVTGAWAVRLFKADTSFQEKRRQAARLQRIEGVFLGQLRRKDLPSKVRITSLADFIENPMVHLQDTLDELTPLSRRHLSEAPKLTDLRGLGDFLQQLTNAGMKPYLAGDIPHDSDLVTTELAPTQRAEGTGS